ncbi:MAG TPA: hypothetical protein VFI56_02140 [Vicinamibacterales bacterium]|nr:hypothetical protein [Vicinamibacterales bacterium]
MRRGKLGELVVVTRCDGTQLTGDIGTWAGSDGFYVKPPDSSAVLMRVSDIRTMIAASNGESLDVPYRRQRSKPLILGVAIAVGVLILAAAGRGLAKS